MIRITTALAMGLALATPPALADLISPLPADISLRVTGFAYGATGVDITLIGDGWVGAGELTAQMTRNGSTSSFLTYCTDIFQSFSWNTDYRYLPAANGTAPGFSNTQADLLGKLYTHAGTTVDSTDESTAFQLAVWEIVNETGPALSVRNGVFMVERGGSEAQRNLADNWLLAIAEVNAPKSFNAERLYSSVAQDFVVFTALPRAGSVAEPGSLALAGLALAALRAARRRRV